jgi:hypothetical protein
VVRTVQDPPRYAVQADYCHDRWCLPCARLRSRVITANVIDALAGRPARLLTLTIATARLSLRESLIKLTSAFRRLRRTPLWRHRVSGGCAIIEVTWSPATRTWHPHYHCILEGRYIPHAQLRRTWLEITGDSYIVDIRLARQPRVVAKYIAAYVAKPASPQLTDDPAVLATAVAWLSRRRLVTTYGSWRGYRLLARPPAPATVELGSLEDWLLKAAQGDAHAVEVLTRIDADALARTLPVSTARAPPPPPPRRRKADLGPRLFSAW